MWIGSSSMGVELVTWGGCEGVRSVVSECMGVCSASVCVCVCVCVCVKHMFCEISMNQYVKWTCVKCEWSECGRGGSEVSVGGRGVK